MAGTLSESRLHINFKLKLNLKRRHGPSVHTSHGTTVPVTGTGSLSGSGHGGHDSAWRVQVESGGLGLGLGLGRAPNLPGSAARRGAGSESPLVPNLTGPGRR